MLFRSSQDAVGRVIPDLGEQISRIGIERIFTGQEGIAPVPEDGNTKYIFFLRLVMAIFVYLSPFVGFIDLAKPTIQIGDGGGVDRYAGRVEFGDDHYSRAGFYDPVIGSGSRLGEFKISVDAARAVVPTVKKTYVDMLLGKGEFA